MDFGSTAVTGIHCSAVVELRDHYGLEKRPVKIHEPYQMLGLVEDDLLDAIGVDTVAPDAISTFFGFPPEDWKPWTTPWGQDVLVPGQFNVTQNEKGTYIYPEGDTSIDPSAHMPTASFFFDTIIRQPEIDDDNLNPEDNLEEFRALTDNELTKIKVAAERAAATGRGVVTGGVGTALGDIALVPAPFLKAPKGIRDIEEWYVSTAIRQDYIHEVFSRQTEIAIANMERISKATGDLLDVVFLCGTDFGTQNGPFCSPAAYRDLYLPYQKRVNGWIHKNTSWKTFMHCCGGVAPLLPSIIEAEFDVLNPVQCSATGMDPKELKREYGRDLVFWGGGVDTQHTLPFGTPDQVREEVKERVDVLGKDGGFVFGSIHNIVAGCPIENVMAMFEVVGELRK